MVLVNACGKIDADATWYALARADGRGRVMIQPKSSLLAPVRLPAAQLSLHSTAVKLMNTL